MARKDDFIPVSDYDLPAWLGVFTDVLNENLDRLDLTPADLERILDEGEAARQAIENNVAKQAEARAATAVKNDCRVRLEQSLRSLVRRINHHPEMDNALRMGLGLNPHREHRSHRGVGPETPHLFLEAKSSLVIVHFGTNPSNEHLNGKPKWARGCNIYRRIGDSGEMAMVTCATSSPYHDTVGSEIARVSYAAAYQGTRNHDTGSFSPMMSVAVGG